MSAVYQRAKGESLELIRLTPLKYALRYIPSLGEALDYERYEARPFTCTPSEDWDSPLLDASRRFMTISTVAEAQLMCDSPVFVQSNWISPALSFYSATIIRPDSITES